MDIAETTTQGEMTPQADLTSKVKSRRKLGIQKSLSQECKPTEGAGDSGSEKLSYSLSNIIDVKVLLVYLVTCADLCVSLLGMVEESYLF